MREPPPPRKCGLEDCAVIFTRPYGTIGTLEVCSPRCLGKSLGNAFNESQKIGASSESKVGVLAQARPVEGALPFVPAPEDLVLASKKKPHLNRLKFQRNIYKAQEIIVLVKVSDDMPVRVMGVMKDVYAYTDKSLGLLLRPNMGGVKPTFPDVPRAIAIAAKPFKRRHKKGEEEAQQEEKQQERAQKIAALKNAPVEGASFGNPSTDNRSKRFFFIESMLLGGTSKEILERADLMAHKARAYQRGEILRSIPSNPANVRAQYERLKSIWHKQGIIGKAVEKDGIWRVELVKK